MVGIATVKKLQVMEESLAEEQQLLLGKPPQWAVDLVGRIAHSQGRCDLPTINWRRLKQHWGSSGLTQTSGLLRRLVLTIRAGRDERDQRMVLLHETAHWLLGTKEGHSPRFYSKAFELFTSHGDLLYGVRRELRYMPAAVRTALFGLGLPPDVVEEMLTLSGARVRVGGYPITILPVLGRDGHRVSRVITKLPLSPGELAEIEAHIRKHFRTVDEPLEFICGQFRQRWVRPVREEKLNLQLPTSL